MGIDCYEFLERVVVHGREIMAINLVRIKKKGWEYIPKYIYKPENLDHDGLINYICLARAICPQGARVSALCRLRSLTH